MINHDSISALKPCKDRFDNYVKHYSGKSFTPKQFMGLKNITHQDKLWVAFRTLSLENLRKCAADIAESVLHIYENKYPNDSRPREAIEAARQYAKGEITIEQLREKRAAATAADAATYAAYAADATATAAYAAAYAATATATAYADATAYAAGAAATAAAYAAAATYAYAAATYATYATYAADATAYAADAADACQSARLVQEKRVRTIILKYWK